MDLDIIIISKTQNLFKKEAQKSVAVKSQYISKILNVSLRDVNQLQVFWFPHIYLSNNCSQFHNTKSRNLESP